MVLDDIKQNINKIDSDLKNLFENVYITEKSDKNGFFVEISANKMFLFEGCKKRVEVKSFINKDDLKFNVIKWNYSLNPLNESASRIERTSYVNSIAKDMYDIASNKRMVKEYFESLEAHVDLILEYKAECFFKSDDSEYKTKLNNICENINKIVNSHVNCKEIFPNIYNENTGFINFKPDTKLNISVKFNLEKELLSYEKVNYVSFSDNDTIKVTIK